MTIYTPFRLGQEVSFGARVVYDAFKKWNFTGNKFQFSLQSVRLIKYEFK